MCAYTGKQDSVNPRWNESDNLRPDGQRPVSEEEIRVSYNSGNEKYRVNEKKLTI